MENNAGKICFKKINKKERLHERILDKIQKKNRSNNEL